MNSLQVHKRLCGNSLSLAQLPVELCSDIDNHRKESYSSFKVKARSEDFRDYLKPLEAVRLVIVKAGVRIPKNRRIAAMRRNDQILARQLQLSGL